MKAPQALKRRMNSRWIRKLLIFMIVFSVSGASIAFWIVGKRVEVSLAEQMLHRQQIVARAGAMSIENFLEFVGSSLASYAGTQDIIEGGEVTQNRLNLFVEEWVGSPVFSIALTDENGVVVASANRQGADQTGVTLADRGYFEWAKEDARPGEVYVGEAVFGRFGPVEDEFLIPVASPSFSNGEFKGVLVATVALSELTKTYLDPLKISEETRLYLTDSRGTILHGPYEKFIGINYFDYLASVEFKGKEYAVEHLWKAAITPEEGKIDVFLPDEVTGKLERFLISHSPIKYQEGRHWTLAVASPMNTALAFFPQFLSHQVGALVFIVFVVLGLSALGILAIRIAQREAFYEGFTRGREHAYRRKKGESKETKKSK